MSDEADLTLLLETNDPIELAGIRSLLDGHEIAYVVQGEHHGAMVTGMFGNPVIMPRVLVAQRDLEKAQALLEADPDTGTEPQGAASLEGAVCPVHEKQALATCGRCGSFLCAECKSLGQPPICEDCTAREEAERPKPARRNALLPWAVIGVLIVLALLAKAFFSAR
jgi:hypothetical protein